MTEDYDPKEYALSLGFSEDEAAMLGEAGAPADNILRVAVGKGYVQPEATEEPGYMTGVRVTRASAVSAAEATSPGETEDERADREAAELRADATAGLLELASGGATERAEAEAVAREEAEAETKHRHYYRADGTCACGRRRKGS